MKEEIKREIEKKIEKIGKDTFEQDLKRRKEAEKAMREIFQRTNLLKGGIFTRKDLADSIKAQRMVHNINPMILPKLIGNYYYNVHFKGYDKSEVEFINEHPEFEKGSGHPGVDLKEFSKDLSQLLSAKGDVFAEAFLKLLSHQGMGIATLSGYLHLYDPNIYPLINGASIGGMETFIGKQYISVIRKFAELEKEKLHITIQIKDPDLRKYLAWSYLIKELKEIKLFENFHLIDFFLWSTHKESKKEHYFAIAFGEDEESKWEEYINQGYHAIGWNEIDQDFSDLADEEIEELYKEKYPDQSTQARRASLYSILHFYHLEPGDKIIANRGKSIILGVGEVVSGYYFEKDAAGFRHRVRVKWTDTKRRNIPEEPSWLWTVKVLSEGHFKDLVDYREQEIAKGKDRYFSSELFDWFEGLSKNPTKDYYNETKFKFNQFVNTPVKSLIKAIIEKLPNEMLKKLETQKHVRAHILKNDFGVGNAYDYLWFAFYPKGESRTIHAQLYGWFNKDGIRYGFYIGEYGKEARLRFKQNVLNNKSLFLEQVNTVTKHSNIKFAYKEGERHGDEGEIVINHPKTATALEDWLSHDAPEIRVSLKKEEVFKMADVAAEIANVFQLLYPIWLYAVVEDEDLPGKGEIILEDEGIDEEEIYPKAQLIADTFFDDGDMDNILLEIERKKHVVFYGPPGTGKTFIAKRIAQFLVEGHLDNIQTIQFHQSYAYEDFIEGIRPVSKKDSSGTSIIDYPVKEGIFKRLCETAQNYPKQKFVMLIDEFNRGNISKIFGELLFLLEYRNEENSVILPYSKEPFFIPENVYIIATLNTADRSLTHIDFAMRRRFSFIPFDVNYNILLKWGQQHDLILDSLCNVLEEINERIRDENYYLGISFFMCENLQREIERIWKYEIYPYIQNYFIDESQETAENFSWENVRHKLSNIFA